MTLVDIIYDRILLAGLEGDDEVRINIASLHYILEAELTAVKGVDELIIKYKELDQAEQMVEAGDVLKDLQDIKQASVAEDDLMRCLYCGEDGCNCTSDQKNGIVPTEEILKDSQPKEVKPIYDAKDPESSRKHIIENMC